MPKEIPPSSFQCDCGHQLDFFSNTVREMEAMSRKKKVRLGDDTDHTVIFHKGNMADVLCPDRQNKPLKKMTTTSHKWAFLPRFRRHAFGWRSQPACQRVKESVTEIKKVSRKDPALAAQSNSLKRWFQQLRKWIHLQVPWVLQLIMP